MGKNDGNFHLQYLFEDLHVIYTFFTYYVNCQLFQYAARLCIECNTEICQNCIVLHCYDIRESTRATG